MLTIMKIKKKKNYEPASYLIGQGAVKHNASICMQKGSLFLQIRILIDLLDRYRKFGNYRKHPILHIGEQNNKLVTIPLS